MSKKTNCGNKVIVCPYCGYKHFDPYEHFRNEEEETNITCHHCNNEFFVSREIEFKYYTRKMTKTLKE